MKYLFNLFLIFSIISCSSGKKVTQKNLQPETIHITAGCPDKMECTVEIHSNKKVDFRYEEVTGKHFPEFVEDSTKTTVKIVFDLNTNPRMTDGQYREEIIFEWPNDQKKINLENAKLRDVEMLFGRFCFCEKSQVGYFKISEGNLKIKNGQIELNIVNSDQIPQRVQQISGTYELKNK